MTYNDYLLGRSIAAESYPFYALIQAAMRQADTDNLEKLKAAWPQVWAELQARYTALRGRLPSDGPKEATP